MVSLKGFCRFKVLLVLGALIFAVFGCGGSSDPDPIVRGTQYGMVEGSVVNGFVEATVIVPSGQKAYQWLGIPFAKPPVGALRWKAPQDPDPWTGVLPAKQYGNYCPQIGSLYAPLDMSQLLPLLGQPIGDEDCLTLNIWRPANTDINLPVFFFIHGGSWKTGGSASFNGTNLAIRANAIVVSTNYRANVFGWLTHPALRTGNPQDDSGNFGTLDLIQALKFVKNNIVNFGGDPNNVTIGGQSAGSGNVFSLMVSPLARGLFHKAVGISLGLSKNSVATGENAAKALLQQLVIADGKATTTAEADTYLATLSNAQIRDFLYSRTKDQLLIATTKTSVLSGTQPALYTDGTVISADPNAAINAGNFNNVPVMMGNTAREGSLFAAYLGASGWKVSDLQRGAWMMTFDPDKPSPLTTADLINNTDDGWITATNGLNSLITASVNATEPLLKAQQDKVYAWSFNWDRAPYPWNIVYGPTHASDLPFWNSNFSLNRLFSCMFSVANRPGRVALANAMMDSLSAFMRTGDPNNASLGGVTWEKYSTVAGGPKKLNFDATDTALNITMGNQ